jgi:hypothetical protein
MELEVLFLEWLSVFIEATGYLPKSQEIGEYRNMYYEMAIEN